MIALLLKLNLLNIDLNNKEKSCIQRSLEISISNMIIFYIIFFLIIIFFYIFINIFLIFLPRKFLFKIFYSLPFFNSALRLLRSYILLIKYEI